MTAVTHNHNQADEHEHDHHHDHHVEDANKVIFGFWLFLMSDCIVFAVLFSCYFVLKDNTFGGIGIHEVASLPYVLIMSIALLTSSLTYGLGFLSYRNDKKLAAYIWLGLTFILGAVFVVMSYLELAELVHMGEDWAKSAFLSAFFTLVSVHLLHVIIGLFWIIIMYLQMACPHYKPFIDKRLTCLGLFWNFLDLVWIFIFTFVYLIGAM